MTLISDGWTNIREECLVNYLLVTPREESFSYKSDPTAAERHTSAYISAELIKIVEEVRPDNINAKCIDTASNTKHAVGCVVQILQLIYFIGYNSHHFGLMIQYVIVLETSSEIMKQAVKVARYF